MRGGLQVDWKHLEYYAGRKIQQIVFDWNKTLREKRVTRGFAVPFNVWTQLEHIAKRKQKRR